MTFQEWMEDNMLVPDDYSICSMERYAELAWYAGISEGRRQAANNNIHNIINQKER